MGLWMLLSNICGLLTRCGLCRHTAYRPVHRDVCSGATRLVSKALMLL